MSHLWDPRRYLSYAAERGRPFLELLARVGAESPRRVVDLGCGPGQLTRLLAERWSHADVLGVDASEEMVAAARTEPGIEVRRQDLRDWVSRARPGEVDVLLSHATLQWVPEHLGLLPELIGTVAPGGWFAFQVPGNFDQPSHTIPRGLIDEEPYAGAVGAYVLPASHEPADYLDALAGVPGVAALDVWETTYHHRLTGPAPVFDWIAGTGLRPILAALPATVRGDFEAELKRRLAVAYPERHGTVVMPFRRIFAVARLAEEG